MRDELLWNEILSYRILFDDLAYSVCSHNKRKSSLYIFGKSSYLACTHSSALIGKNFFFTGYTLTYIFGSLVVYYYIEMTNPVVPLSITQCLPAQLLQKSVCIGNLPCSTSY